MRRGALIAAALAACVSSAYAEPDPEIESARRLIEVELRFAEGAEILESLAQKELPREQKLDVYRLLGIAYVARGAPEAAQAAFGALLSLDPGFDLDPRLSPKILEVFNKVRAKMIERPKLVDVTAEVVGEQIIWKGRIEDPLRLAVDVMLYTRRPPEAFLGTKVSIDGLAHLDARLPATATDGELRVEYYVIARDVAGRIVAQVGSPEAPSSLVVERVVEAKVDPNPIVVAPILPAEPELYERWWFWVGVGALAVGTGVGLVLLSGTETTEGTLPAIQLE
ncbi:MAG: hypothetical protein HY791_26215 [Deltaproteobacteria bacterium]|nr:hypothetical protein [Deltaproteobacteria bacterium]